MNKELDNSDFNISVDESQEEEKPAQKPVPKKGFEKSAIGSKMSKILADFDENETLKLNCELMIVKPDKLKNQKAKYEDTTVEYFINTSKITFTNKNKAV